MDRICEFLGIAPLPDVAPDRHHVNEYAEPLDTWARGMLLEYFRADTHRLEEKVGWSCREWLEDTETTRPDRDETGAY